VPPPTAGSRSIAPMMYSDALLTRTSWSTIVFFYGPEATILVVQPILWRDRAAS
jgi:hypothetical protein